MERELVGNANASWPGAGAGAKLKPRHQPPEILLKRGISLPQHVSRHREQAVLAFGRDGDTELRASGGGEGEAVSCKGLATGVRSQRRPLCAVGLGLPCTTFLQPRAAGVAGGVSHQQVPKNQGTRLKTGFLIFGRPLR